MANHHYLVPLVAITLADAASNKESGIVSFGGCDKSSGDPIRNSLCSSLYFEEQGYDQC
jgi:hypothetical protein